MITTATSIQTAYNKLYTEFRNYIWDFRCIEALADLEIEVYQTFPDVDKIKSKFSKLKREISFTDAFKTDDELKEVFDDFESDINDVEGLYANLKSFREVVTL